MFDTKKVANNIKAARTKMNMTQMNLADEMGVSYQAVSNWERGNSMPDISKLPELCEILNITFEELVGEKTEETRIAEKLMQDEHADVTLEEMAKVGQLVKPSQLVDKAKETLDEGGKIPFSVLVGLAPFMDKETLGKLAEELAEVNMKKLCAIAPFLGRQTLDKIMDKCMAEGKVDGNGVVGVAPFLAKETVQKLAGYFISHGQADKLIGIAPFMGKEMFPGGLKDVKFGVKKDAKGDMTGDNLDLDEMDEDDVAALAFEAFEKGEGVEEYLDYMDEDDVEDLAVRAMEQGKDVEMFLDYLDEDAVKSLLRRSMKK